MRDIFRRFFEVRVPFTVDWRFYAGIRISLYSWGLGPSLDILCGSVDLSLAFGPITVWVGVDDLYIEVDNEGAGA